MIGTSLTHYLITAKLGEGGMGEVYRAKDTKLGREVAIKVLPASISRHPQSLARFEREAKALAALNHPHIAGIHGFDADQGSHFLVLELVEGETLAERLRRGPLPLKEALTVARQIAEAIHEAHEKGIIHRDLKPGNVKITGSGMVKVLDFGLAKVGVGVPGEPIDGVTVACGPDAPTIQADITLPGAVMGTPAYMSPEQARGQEVDKRTDIWAFGCCFYECLSGRKPFRGQTASDLMAEVLKSDPDWSQVPSETPREIVTLLRRCLEKEPLRRLSSIGDIAITLDESSRGTATSSSSLVRASAGESAKWLRPVMAGLSIFIIAAGVYFWKRSGPDRNSQAGSDIVRSNVLPVAPPDPVAASATDQKSIAVLPFVNMSGNSENEYFSDGITEEILNALARTPGLRVAARTSAFYFKGKNEPVQKIGKALGVGVLLEGSVRRADNQLRITAHLINVADGLHLWSDTFDRNVEDVFAIQSEVAQRVLEALKLKLRDSGPSPLRIGTDNLEAYDLFLRGRQLWNKRTEADLHKAKDLFREAIEMDPKFAPALAGVADCYNALAYLNFLAPADAFPKAEASASKAIEMDPTLPAGHAALGYCLMYYKYDFQGAEHELQQSIRLNPNYVTARHYYGILLTAMGRMKEAVEEIERAQKLDVLSLPITTDMGFQLHYQGKQKEAIRQLESALEMNSQFPLAHFWLGRIYTTQRQYEKALAEYEAVPSLHTWQPMMAAKGFLYGVWGKPDEAKTILADFDAMRSENRFVTSYGVALVFAGMGNTERALEWLEKAYAEKSHWLVWLKLDPRWDGLRNESRFLDLVKRVFPDK